MKGDSPRAVTPVRESEHDDEHNALQIKNDKT